MRNITIFETNAQAVAALAEYVECNNVTLGKIREIGRAKEAEYRTKTGYDKKVKSPSPDLKVHLPPAERQKLWVDVGKGLELNCMVSLKSYNGNYYFLADVTEPLGSNEDEYSTINDLVDGVRNYLTRESARRHGAGITPHFYTIKEEKTLNSEERENLRLSQEAWDSIPDNVPLEVLGLKEKKEQFKSVLDYLVAAADIPKKGLTPEECAEFEKLFYK